MSDALEQAIETLEAAGDIIQKDAQKSPTILAGDYAWTAEQCIQTAQTAALIAIAEELRGIKAILCNATTLGGAIKLNSDDDFEQISNHLDDIGSVLLNARGPDGAIKIAQ